jgi:AraC-like DNA-binding protein
MGVDRFLVRFKALETPYYQETRPSEDLRDVVACRWVRVARFEGLPGPSSIIPDGCADIMVYDDAPPHVAGPDATTRWLTLPEGTVITGIRLRPGTVQAVCGCDAGLIVDGGAPLSDLAPGAAWLHQRLLSATSLEHRHAVLEAWVRTALRRYATRDHAVAAACRRLTANPQAEVGDVARRFGWTARTIHRHFRAACGYGPKHFQRIMRIQRAIRIVHATAPARLTDVAHAAGYADHAHMARDFRDITGFSPRQYLLTSRPEWGVWLGEDW